MRIQDASDARAVVDNWRKARGMVATGSSGPSCVDGRADGRGSCASNDLGEAMKTFKNKHFKTRDYEATNIVACEAERAPDENYVEADVDLSKLTMLWSQGGVRYWGYL